MLSYPLRTIITDSCSQTVNTLYRLKGVKYLLQYQSEKARALCAFEISAYHLLKMPWANLTICTMRTNKRKPRFISFAQSKIKIKNIKK